MKKSNIDIENFLSATRYITKQEIMEKTGLCERQVRDLVSKLKKKRVVIYSSQTKGWRLAKEYSSMSKIEREEELNQIKHSLNDCKTRVDDFYEFTDDNNCKRVYKFILDIK